VAYHEDLGLDDRDETIGLADGSVSGERHGVLIDSYLGGGDTSRVGDVKHSSPLREACACLVVVGTSLVKVIETLSDGLAVGTIQRLHSLVNLSKMHKTCMIIIHDGDNNVNRSP
jgi:hypothetical protein